MERKQISFGVTEEEHTAIKKLATERRQSIKGLIFTALDKLIPGWNREEKKEK